MKKLCFVFLAMAMVAGVALADPAVPDPGFTGDYQMVTTYVPNATGGWDPIDKTSAAKLAATYTSGGAEGNGNKRVWTVDIVNHASIAQWIDWEFTYTRWDLAGAQTRHLRRRLHRLQYSEQQRRGDDLLRL